MESLKITYTYLHYFSILIVGFIHRLYYKPGTWLDGYPTLLNGDGDGTVNLRSLQGCLNWRTLQKQKIYGRELPKVDHLQILHDSSTLNYITDIVKGNHKKNQYRKRHKKLVEKMP